MIKLRITADGRIRGLWTDEIPLQAFGTVRVKRASHVEFDDRRQCWTVRAAEPRNRTWRLFQHCRRELENGEIEVVIGGYR